MEKTCKSGHIYLSHTDTSGWFATEQHQVSEQDRSRGYLDLEPVDTNERWKTLDDEIAAYSNANSLFCLHTLLFTRFTRIIACILLCIF